MNGGSEFEKQLQLVKQLGFRAIREISIDLTNIVADKEYNIAGNFFYIKDAPDSEVYIEVKVNSSGVSPISWTKQTGFLHPFNRLYITTPTGQTGTMNILIAAEAPGLFNILDHRSAMSDTMVGILNELKGQAEPGKDGAERIIGITENIVFNAEPNRRAMTMQAKSSNTGVIYLGFTNAVTLTSCFAELQPGQACMIDDYRGPIHAISDTADQRLIWGSW
ncbi:hypothetical protein ES703_88502 [subsurface metagenome]